VELLEAARGDRYEALYVLCLTSGRRQGGTLGLKRSDVDLDTDTLRVNRQLQRVRRQGGKSGSLAFSEPKNASRRAVGLPPRAVRTLEEHSERQLEDKRGAGHEWQETTLVLTNSKGKPLEAQNVVNRSFKSLLGRAGLPPIRFHGLRYSCLSLLASRGEPIRDLQAIAGRSSGEDKRTTLLTGGSTVAVNGPSSSPGSFLTLYFLAANQRKIEVAGPGFEPGTP